MIGDIILHAVNIMNPTRFPRLGVEIYPLHNSSLYFKFEAEVGFVDRVTFSVVCSSRLSAFVLFLYRYRKGFTRLGITIVNCYRDTEPASTRTPVSDIKRDMRNSDRYVFRKTSLNG